MIQNYLDWNRSHKHIKGSNLAPKSFFFAKNKKKKIARPTQFK